MNDPLDLFDEELLQAIAYDPEAWIDQLLRDDRFKVIVVCSQVISYKLKIIMYICNLVEITLSMEGSLCSNICKYRLKNLKCGRVQLRSDIL